jgi:hypothetical protein
MNLRGNQKALANLLNNVMSPLAPNRDQPMIRQ